MTPDDAKAESKHLVGLFPTLTPEQLKLWRAEFQRYPRDACRKAVDRHHLTHNFVDPPQLNELLRAETARAAQREQDSRRHVADVEARWRDIERVIEQTPDDELGEWKRQVLAAVPVVVGALLSKSDPRRSRTLKGLIYEAITAATSRVAKGEAA